MRFKIIIDLKGKVIPIKYHSLLQGMIYNSMISGYSAEELHNVGYKFGKRKFKLFTYSEIYGETIHLKETNELQFNSEGCFYFSSHNNEFSLSFMKFLTQNNSIVLGKQIIKITSFTILDDNVGTNNEEMFFTISPITAYVTNKDKQTTYFVPGSEEFNNSIIQNLAQKYFLIYNENMPEIEITETTKIKKKIIYFRKTFCVAYHCNIKFKNLTTKVKYIILTCGLGSKNSSGLGMVLN